MTGSRIVLEQPIDLSSLPASRTERGNPTGYVLILFALVWIGIATTALTRLPDGDRTTGAIAVFAILTGIGLALLVAAVAALRRRRTLTLDRHEVVQEVDGLLGSRRRVQSIEAFSGLGRREIMVRTSTNSGVRTAHQVVLESLEDAAGVVLYATVDVARARAFQIDAARALGLPIVVPDADGTMRAVSPDDVDTPLVDRARSGEIGSDAPDLAAIPPNLELAVHGDTVEVTIVRRLVKVPPALAFLALAAAMIAARPVLGAPWIVTGLGTLFAFVISTLLVLDRIANGCLVLAPDRIETCWRLRLGSRGTFQHRSLAIEDVRDVRIRPDAQKRKQLAIEGHAAVLEFGYGLDPTALAWIRALVIQNARRAADARDSTETPPRAASNIAALR